jgi:predicted aspartyl protease
MNQPVRRALKQEYVPVSKKLTAAVEVIGISAQNPGQKVTVRALWDTGAEFSLIGPEISDQLGLIPIGSTRIYGVNTVSRVDKVKAAIILPNNIRIPNITILVCNLIPDIDMLIGMDIISCGDLAISNASGKTLLTFAIPPFEDKIDLYERAALVNGI